VALSEPLDAEVNSALFSRVLFAASSSFSEKGFG
jgi:hypothetical protein